MSTGRIEIGPTGRTVAANLKRIRDARGLSLRALSRLVSERGRPLSVDALNKIEKGASDQEAVTRRVDVDDLIALAAALRVNPSALLLPDTADETAAEITTAGAVPAWKAWKWMDGQEPLTEPFDVDDYADFQMFARPKGKRKYYRKSDLTSEDRDKIRRDQEVIARRIYETEEERAAHMDREGRKLYGDDWDGTWR